MSGDKTSERNNKIRHFISEPFRRSLLCYVKKIQPMNPFHENLKDESCGKLLNHLRQGGLAGRVFNDQQEMFLLHAHELLQDLEEDKEIEEERLQRGVESMNKLLVIMDERELQDELNDILGMAP